MTVIRQVALIPAGCQPWNRNVLAARGKRFAYAATLAIYIYEWNSNSNQFYLHSIMSEHKKTITAIEWHPANDDILASSGSDDRICVWHITQHCLLAVLNNPSTVPSLLTWFPNEENSLGYSDGKAPVYMWKFQETQDQNGYSCQAVKDITTASKITQICWHRKIPGRLALGHADGSISLYLQGHKAQHNVKPSGVLGKDLLDKQESAVSSMLWDPFSPNYLLVLFSAGNVFLIDTSSKPIFIVTAYTPPSKAVTIKCLAWLNEAPGAFVSGDAETGVLRIWTVSKEKPLENLRLKQTGFQALCVMPLDNNSPSTQQSGRTEMKAKFRSRIVCLFADGGIGVYSLKLSSWEFYRDMGHLETIFDCQFKPDNCDLLATASFDGTIKVWNVNTMEAEHYSPGDESIVYSISWAPSDLNCLVAATSKRGLFIWNVTKGCITKRIDDHGNGIYVYCVAWNQMDARKIASAGADGTCMIHQADGKLINTFQHPATVFGCDWNPNNEAIVATACEDGLIRIFYDGSGTSHPLKILSGHAGKAFRVKWSPLKEGMLCSTSDDCTVRVWDYSSGLAVRILQGHTNYTRGLLWSPELPNVIMSGSWDFTIRVWDISDGACLDVVEDHGADVYGLACHAERPFLFASTSRDSTVRLWSCLPLVSMLFVKSLANRPLSEIFSPKVTQKSYAAEYLGLHGSCSKKIKTVMKQQNNQCSLLSLRSLSRLFCPPTGLSNFWNLVLVLSGENEESMFSRNGISHRKHVVTTTIAKAQEKELVKMTRYGAGGVGAPSKEECLRSSAEYYLCTGHLKKYCELSVELGEWLPALAVAPGVSMKYWQELTSRWMKVLIEENNSQLLPLAIATGNMKDLLSFYQKQNRLEESYLVSVAAAEGFLKSHTYNCCEKLTDVKSTHVDYEVIIKENVTSRSERYLLCGSAVLAACCNLAVDQIQDAFYALLRGHELELAVCLALALNYSGPSLLAAVTQLSWRCAEKGEWELALEILDLHPDSNLQKVQICANCGLSLPERNQLHEKAGLPPVDSCLDIARLEVENNGPVLNAIQYYLLSNEPKKGLDIGLAHIKECLDADSWELDSLWKVLRLMAAVRPQVLQDTNCDRHRFEIQVYSAYIGAYVAVRQGYVPIVTPLFTKALSLIRRVHNPNLAITEDIIVKELNAWIHSQKSPEMLTDEVKEHYNKITSKAFQTAPCGDVGITIVSGSHLPRHSDHHQCYLRGTAIQGPVFFLDDYKSVISLNDALMWAKVNRFSPLSSGLCINPF